MLRTAENVFKRKGASVVASKKPKTEKKTKYPMCSGLRGASETCSSRRPLRRWFDSATPFLSLENLNRVVELFGIDATVAEEKTAGPVMTMNQPKDRPMQFSFRRCALKEKTP